MPCYGRLEAQCRRGDHPALSSPKVLLDETDLFLPKGINLNILLDYNNGFRTLADAWLMYVFLFELLDQNVCHDDLNTIAPVFLGPRNNKKTREHHGP
jgi:hypothetical protein